ncbi:Orofacial cleft 1 candidate gene 1 protein like protein [Aduncisulcus paluster]|uniref:Orofacial cleft 1 candidate gene 1 protein like protein n=1 Tax=Aduncisulcus paluster TaxID=2918883 RepID=A0ABQ5K059_9EUKA|nr:Orofacial cleft 1 candidate gene 1 protein like protein [Aduncisulcus paluster]
MDYNDYLEIAEEELEEASISLSEIAVEPLDTVLADLDKELEIIDEHIYNSTDQLKKSTNPEIKYAIHSSILPDSIVSVGGLAEGASTQVTGTIEAYREAAVDQVKFRRIQHTEDLALLDSRARSAAATAWRATEDFKDKQRRALSFAMEQRAKKISTKALLLESEIIKNAEKNGCVVSISRATSGSASAARRFRVEPLKTPVQMRFGVHCIRGVRMKLDRGMFIMTVHVRHKLGGVPMCFERDGKGRYAYGSRSFSGVGFPFSNPPQGVREIGGIPDIPISQDLFLALPPMNELPQTAVYIFELWKIASDRILGDDDSRITEAQKIDGQEVKYISKTKKYEFLRKREKARIKKAKKLGTYKKLKQNLLLLQKKDKEQAKAALEPGHGGQDGVSEVTGITSTGISGILSSGGLSSSSATMDDDEVVGWGSLPVSDVTHKLNEGKLKIPILHGAVDQDITLHNTISELISSDIDAWLGNMYVELTRCGHSGDGHCMVSVTAQNESSDDLDDTVGKGKKKGKDTSGKGKGKKAGGPSGVMDTSRGASMDDVALLQSDGGSHVVKEGDESLDEDGDAVQPILGRAGNSVTGGEASSARSSGSKAPSMANHVTLCGVPVPSSRHMTEGGLDDSQWTAPAWSNASFYTANDNEDGGERGIPEEDRMVIMRHQMEKAVGAGSHDGSGQPGRIFGVEPSEQHSHGNGNQERFLQVGTGGGRVPVPSSRHMTEGGLDDSQWTAPAWSNASFYTANDNEDGGERGIPEEDRMVIMRHQMEKAVGAGSHDGSGQPGRIFGVEPSEQHSHGNGNQERFLQVGTGGGRGSSMSNRSNSRISAISEKYEELLDDDYVSGVQVNFVSTNPTITLQAPIPSSITPDCEYFRHYRTCVKPDPDMEATYTEAEMKGGFFKRVLPTVLKLTRWDRGDPWMWMFIVWMLLLFWFRPLIHYGSQYLFLWFSNFPIRLFEIDLPRSVVIDYQRSVVPTQTEGFLIAGPSVILLAISLVLIFFHWLLLALLAKAPHFLSWLIYSLLILAFLDPIVQIVEDTFVVAGLGCGWGCSCLPSYDAGNVLLNSDEDTAQYVSDFGKLYDLLIHKEGSGIVGTLLTITILIALCGISFSILSVYILKLFENGTITDAYHRMCDKDQTFVNPSDIEISSHELRLALCRMDGNSIEVEDVQEHDTAGGAGLSGTRIGGIHGTARRPDNEDEGVGLSSRGGGNQTASSTLLSGSFGGEDSEAAVESLMPQKRRSTGSSSRQVIIKRTSVAYIALGDPGIADTLDYYGIYDQDNTGLSVLKRHFVVSKESGRVFEIYVGIFGEILKELGLIPANRALYGERWFYEVQPEEVFGQIDPSGSMGTNENSDSGTLSTTDL